jgi:two-component system KDP operon response regulator KdpE
VLGHLLIVEDDPAAAFMLAAALRFAQFDCDVAQSGVEAILLAHKRKYDAILLDLNLPDFDGHQLIQALRSRIDIPMVVVSGQDVEEDKVRALDLGADDYVAKPYMPGELLARIRAVLRRSSHVH